MVSTARELKDWVLEIVDLLSDMIQLLIVQLVHFFLYIAQCFLFSRLIAQCCCNGTSHFLFFLLNVDK